MKIVIFYLIIKTKSHVASTVINPKSDEFVLDQLSIIEEKLVKLYEELDAQGLNETKQQMSKDEAGTFYLSTTSDAKLPPYNTRIQMATRGVTGGVSGADSRPFEDDEMSGDEGAEDFLNYRDQIKQASKQIVDSKTKRHHQTKKNKK